MLNKKRVCFYVSIVWMSFLWLYRFGWRQRRRKYGYICPLPSLRFPIYTRCSNFLFLFKTKSSPDLCKTHRSFAWFEQNPWDFHRIWATFEQNPLDCSWIWAKTTRSRQDLAGSKQSRRKKKCIYMGICTHFILFANLII